MKLFTYTAMICLACLLLQNCKKAETESQTQAQDKLLGKWNLISELTNNFYNGASHYTTYPFAAGDYVEFRSDGKYIEFKSSQSSTYSWGRVNDLKIWLLFPGNEYELRSMTATSVQLYKKEVYSATEYYESTLSLTK